MLKEDILTTNTGAASELFLVIGLSLDWAYMPWGFYILESSRLESYKFRNFL